MSAVMSDVMSDSNSHCRLFDSVPRGNGATKMSGRSAIGKQAFAETRRGRVKMSGRSAIGKQAFAETRRGRVKI
jgi:hypothetical protein